jgi:hypothetical protein
MAYNGFKGVGPRGLGTSPLKQKKSEKSLTFEGNANRSEPTEENQNPKVNYSGNVRFSPKPNFNVSANANSDGGYGVGVSGRSKSGKTDYGASFNRDKQGSNVSANATFKF